VPRIEIASVKDDIRALGRPLMSDHNLSARLWATAAVAVVPFASHLGVGWWLPIHLAMLGAASQAIVGGQLMFSTTLGLARGPQRSQSLTQLALLNIGAALVVSGRLWDEAGVLAAGAVVFAVTICWVTWQVHRVWRRSSNRRFSITGTFYLLAGLSLLVGASIGGLLGTGSFNNGATYLAYRGLHMTLNVLGWAGLTIVGTVVTLLPTVMHVRAPNLHVVRITPWTMFGGLVLLSIGVASSSEIVQALAMCSYVIGLVSFAVYVRRILVIPRRRRIPTAALHPANGAGLGSSDESGVSRFLRRLQSLIDARPPSCRRSERFRFPSFARRMVVLGSQDPTARAAAAARGADRHGARRARSGLRLQRRTRSHSGRIANNSEQLVGRISVGVERSRMGTG
jgi:hypothetical protein